MNRKQSFFTVVFVLLWAVLMLMFDWQQGPITDAEAMRNSIKWGLP